MLSIPKPTNEILPATAPAMMATKPSRVFHPMVKYSSFRPWRTTAVRSNTTASAMSRVYNMPERHALVTPWLAARFILCRSASGPFLGPFTVQATWRSRVQLGSKTWPFCADFGGLIVLRATESMGLREGSSTHNPKVVSSNLTPETISKACLLTGLRDSRRANWEQVLVTQLAKLKSQANLFAP